MPDKLLQEKNIAVKKSSLASLQSILSIPPAEPKAGMKNILIKHCCIRLPDVAAL